MGVCGFVWCVLVSLWGSGADCRFAFGVRCLGFRIKGLLWSVVAIA